MHTLSILTDEHRTPFVVLYSFGSVVMWLDPLIHADDRSARYKVCNIALFRPTFSAFCFPYIQLNTGSLTVLCFLPAAYCCKLDMQCREKYTQYPRLKTHILG